MSPDEESKVDVNVEEEAETEEAKKVREETEKKAKKEAARKKKLKTKTVKKDDMVFVDILGKTLEEDDKKNIVFQASNPEDAQLLLNYDPEKAGQYVNDLAIIGTKGFLDDKIDDFILEGIKFFEEKTLTLEPADAFGAREGKKIEKVSQKQFMKDMKGEKPYPGANYTDKKGRHGTVIRAAQGRLLVDFNHPLAGKKIQYVIKVTDSVEGFDGRCHALLARRLGGMQSLGEMFELTHLKEDKILEIEIPQMLMFQLSQQQGGGIYFKMGVAMDLQEHLKAVDTVKFIEKFEKTPSPVPTHDHDHDHEHEDTKEATESSE